MSPCRLWRFGLPVNQWLCRQKWCTSAAWQSNLAQAARQHPFRQHWWWSPTTECVIRILPPQQTRPRASLGVYTICGGAENLFRNTDSQLLSGMVWFPEDVVERQRWKVQAEDLYILKKM
jgi:hypothetical protein